MRADLGSPGGMPEKRQGRLFVSLLSAAASYTADTSIFPIVLAGLSKDFDIEPGGSALLAYSYNIALMVGLAPACLASSYRRLIWLFRTGLVVYSCGALLLLVSDVFDGLLAARILMGLGAGAFSPLIPSIIAVAFEERAKYLAYWATTTGIVCVVVPLLVVVSAPFLALQDAMSLILGLSLLAVSLLSGRVPAAVATVVPSQGRSSANSSKIGLLYVLGTVFIIYGQLTWLMYTVPLVAAEQGVTDTRLAILGTSPWLAFTISSIAMKRIHVSRFPACLALSAILSAFCLAAFVGPPARSFLWLCATLFCVGAAMALANIPSTVLAFSFVHSSRYGLISSLDILSARSGATVYLYCFNWTSPSPLIILTSLPLVLLLAFIFTKQQRSG